MQLKQTALTLALSFLLLAGGCGANSSAEIETVEKDIYNWALPLDPYRSPNSMVLAYAADIIRNKCLSKAGFEGYPIIPYNENAPGSPSVNESGRRLFNSKLAAQYGYHLAPSQRYSAQLLQERPDGPEDPGYEAASDKCELEVKNAGIDFEDLNDDVVWNISQSIDVTNSPQVEEAAEQWFSCMEPVGVPALPYPTEMPGPVLSEKFGIGRATEWDAPPASAEEISIAVADAECQESSGFAEALYEAEYQAQQEVVKKNAKKLAPLLERNRKALEAARKVIAEQG